MVIQLDTCQQLTRLLTTKLQGVLLRLPLLAKHYRIAVEIQTATDDLTALGRLGLATQCDVQAKAIQQLRAQFAFFRVHGADQYEARCMAMGNTIPLDHIDAAGSNVQQQVDQMVGEQIDLIDVQHTAVGFGEYTRGKLCTTLGQRGVQIQRADQTLFSSTQRQGDELTTGQHIGQSPRQRRLGHAPRPFDQYAADARVNGGQAQRQLQVIGTDHGGQRKMCSFGDVRVRQGHQFSSMSRSRSSSAC